MSIIVEGFDNSGKSTLAASFGLDVVHPGPRPKSDLEILRCIDEQQSLASLALVQDRVTAISHAAYAMDYKDPRYLFRAAMELARTDHCVIVYCRPPTEVIMNFKSHVDKGYDTPEHIEWLKKHGHEIIIRYDAIMSQLPHLVYDYTNPNPAVVSAAYNTLDLTQR